MLRTDKEPTNAALGELPIAADGPIASFDEEMPTVDEQLSRLMDLLVALRIDLTTGLMPRAARITGTSDRLNGAVDYVDAAIRLARDAAIRVQRRD
jgi:hypothetical protein